MRTAVTACREKVEERTSSTGFASEIPSRSSVPRQGAGSSPAAYPTFPHLRPAPPQLSGFLSTGAVDKCAGQGWRRYLRRPYGYSGSGQGHKVLRNVTRVIYRAYSSAGWRGKGRHGDSRRSVAALP